MSRKKTPVQKKPPCVRAKDQCDRTAERLMNRMPNMETEEEIIAAIAKALRQESNAAYKRGRIFGFAEGMK